MIIALISLAMACQTTIPQKLIDSESWVKCLEQIPKWDGKSVKQKAKIIRLANYCDCAKLKPIQENCLNQ